MMKKELFIKMFILLKWIERVWYNVFLCVTCSYINFAG